MINRRDYIKLGLAAGTAMFGRLPFGLTAVSDQASKTIIAGSKAQIVFVGGSGGVVSYDGKGGPLVKDGGPFDRLFVLRNEGLTFNLGGDIGLDVIDGKCRLRTGRLVGDVKVTKAQWGDTLVYFNFQRNDSKEAVEIRGGIAELNLPNDTILFSSTIEPSEMVWMVGDVTRRHPMLPYSALHRKFFLHPAILERFMIKRQGLAPLAATAWCKTPPDEEEMSLRKNTNYGVAFRTQQHLGNLRVFV